MINRIVSDYGHKYDDAESWLSTVEYNLGEEGDDKNESQAFPISLSHTNESVRILKLAKLIPESFSSNQLWEKSLKLGIAAI